MVPIPASAAFALSFESKQGSVVRPVAARHHFPPCFATEMPLMAESASFCEPKHWGEPSNPESPDRQTLLSTVFTVVASSSVAASDWVGKHR